MTDAPNLESVFGIQELIAEARETLVRVNATLTIAQGIAEQARTVVTAVENLMVEAKMAGQINGTWSVKLPTAYRRMGPE